jgi:hypothetical protein
MITGTATKFYGTRDILSTTDSLTLRTLALLAGPAPSGSTSTSRHCRGCFPPSPAFPGPGCPQLQSGRYDDPTERTLTPLDIREVDPGRPAGVAIGWFPRIASRTRRAPLSAPGAPQAP